MAETLYSTSEVAMLFKVNRVTIYRWIKKGKIKAYKIGNHNKISVSEVMRLLKKFGFSESAIYDLCGDDIVSDRGLPMTNRARRK